MRGIVKPKYCGTYVMMLMLALALAGCKVKRPDYVIPENKMADLLYDYHIAKAMGDNLPYNENYKRTLYVEYVFKKYGTSQEIFDSSLVWYTRNTKVLVGVYENVAKRLKAQQEEINTLVAKRDNKPKMSARGDSIDVWVWERLYRLSGSPLSNRLTFTLPSDTNFKARDTLSWEVNYHFLRQRPDSNDIAVMAMQIQYSNDSVIGVSRMVNESGRHDLRLHSDTLGDIKEIRGFIYYPRRSDSIKSLLVNQIAMHRYHSDDSLFNIRQDSIRAAADSLKAALKKTEIQPVIQPQKLDTLQPVRRTERPRPIQRRD